MIIFVRNYVYVLKYDCQTYPMSNYYCHKDIRMQGTGKLHSKLKVFPELILYKIGTSIHHKTVMK